MEQINHYIVTPLETENQSILNTSDQQLIDSYSLSNVIFYPEKYRLDLSYYTLTEDYLETYQNVKSYTVLDSTNAETGTAEITVSPETDATNNGYLGDVILGYEVFNNLFSPNLNSDSTSNLYIVDISSDRTEIRASSMLLSESTLRAYAEQIYAKLNTSGYFSEIYLNFGTQKVVGVNITTELVDNKFYVDFKLYEPLPVNISAKDIFSVEEKIGTLARFKVERQVEIISDPVPTLKGPNFNILVRKADNISTEYQNYNQLINYIDSSSFTQLRSVYKNNEAQLGIDYGNWEEFVHFSSAKERLENFRYKLGQIKDSELKIAILQEINPNDPDIQTHKKAIENYTANFDAYERYMYYESGSNAWPKESSEKPYDNINPSDIRVQSWWNNAIEGATLYDENNEDILVRSIPILVREDKNNEPYIMFVHMIGQHFDDIWVYTKAITSKYDADNRLDRGISKDLVKEAIRSLGLDVNDSNQNLSQIFSKFNIDGTFDKGQETSINTLKRISAAHDSAIVCDGEGANSTTTRIIDGGLASASFDNIIDGAGARAHWPSNTDFQPILEDDYRKEVYKRIYHNIPYLLKTKGTSRGLRALINCFGIPEDILNIKAFGSINTISGSYFGPIEGTYNKVKTDDTGSFVPFTYNSDSDSFETVPVLNQDVSMRTADRKYSDSLSETELGINLNLGANNYFKSKLASQSFDYDNIIGNPKNLGENYKGAFIAIRDSLLAQAKGSHVKFKSPASIIRLIAYLDSTLLALAKDFIPARDSTALGAIIENTFLDRNRYSGVDPTSSLQEDMDAEIETVEISGGSCNLFNNLRKTNKYLTFYKPGHGDVERYCPTDAYLQDWSTPNLAGTKAIIDNSPTYNGEFEGSTCVAADSNLIKHNYFRGTLIDGNPYLKPDSISFKYNLTLKYLCLPEVPKCSIVFDSINKYRVIGIEASANAKYTIGDYYGQVYVGSASATDTLNGGTSTSSFTDTVGNLKTYAFETESTAAISTAQIPASPGYISVPNSSFQVLEVFTEPKVNNNNYIFAGWWKNFDNNSTTDQTDNFVTSNTKLTIESSSISSNNSFTARYVTSPSSFTKSCTVSDNMVTCTLQSPVDAITCIIKFKTTIGSSVKTYSRTVPSVGSASKSAIITLPAGETLSDVCISEIIIDSDKHIKASSGRQYVWVAGQAIGNIFGSIDITRQINNNINNRGRR